MPDLFLALIRLAFSSKIPAFLNQEDGQNRGQKKIAEEQNKLFQPVVQPKIWQA